MLTHMLWSKSCCNGEYFDGVKELISAHSEPYCLKSALYSRGSNKDLDVLYYMK